MIRHIRLGKYYVHPLVVGEIASHFYYNPKSYEHADEAIVFGPAYHAMPGIKLTFLEVKRSSSHGSMTSGMTVFTAKLKDPPEPPYPVTSIVIGPGYVPSQVLVELMTAYYDEDRFKSMRLNHERIDLRVPGGYYDAGEGDIPCMVSGTTDNKSKTEWIKLTGWRKVA